MRDVSEIVAQLDLIAEELADRAIVVLQEAVEAGQSTGPAEERQLTRARAALEKASGILAGLAETT